MADRSGTLQKYVGDMLAVEKHILEAIERQLEEDRVKRNTEAFRVVSSIRPVLQNHVSTLDDLVKREGAEGSSMTKEAITAAAGIVAGLYDKIRSDPVSKMLRDDYVALCMNIMANEMLHTTGLALRNQQVAEVALRHLKDVVPLVRELARVVPHVVVTELAAEAGGIDEVAASEAERNVQEAFSAKQ
jgi:hypothetical protein